MTPFSSQKVRDLCTFALRDVGVVASGNPAQAEDLDVVLYTLNEIRDSMNANGQMSYTMEYHTFPIVATQEFYTIGPDGDFDIANRPTYIEVAMQTYPGNSAYQTPIRLVTMDEYAWIRTKQTTSTIANVFAYETGFPLGKIYFWPLIQGGVSITFTILKHLETNLTLDDVVAWPPGYARMIRYNVICNISRMFGKTIPPDVMAIYSDIKTDIASLNAKSNTVRYGAGIPGIRGAYNIYSGN